MNAAPVATIRGYRRTGDAVVTIERPGRSPQRHCVSLARYKAVQQWVLFWPHGCKTSGSWLRSSFSGALWPQEVPHQ